MADDATTDCDDWLLCFDLSHCFLRVRVSYSELSADYFVDLKDFIG